MTLEAIQTITAAERDAQALRAEQSAKAKRLLEETEAAGHALLRRTEQEGRQKHAEQMCAAEEASARASEALLAESESLCDKLRSAARARMAGAGRLIVERVVSG